MGSEDIKRELLYNLEGKLKNEVALIEKASIAERNKEVLKELKNHLLAKGLSVHRVLMYLRMARLIGETCKKDYISYTKEDIDYIVTTLRPKYEIATMNLVRMTFKVLYRYLKGQGDTYTDPVIAHLKEKKAPIKLKKEDLITTDEFNRLVAAASTLKNGFMWSVMLHLSYETAGRPQDIRGLTLNSVIKNSNGYVLKFAGLKTGTERNAYVITSAGMLERWITSYPNNRRNDGTAPLFFTMKNGKMQFVKHHTYNQMFYRLTTQVLGVRKPLYRLRASRISELVVKGIPERIIKKVCGHSQSSDKLKHYIALNDADVENSMLALAGKPIENKIDNGFIARNCPKCGSVAAPYEALCGKCGEIINRNGIAIREEKPKFDFASLNQEEKDYMREEMRKMAQELAKQMVAGQKQ